MTPKIASGSRMFVCNSVAKLTIAGKATRCGVYVDHRILQAGDPGIAFSLAVCWMGWLTEMVHRLDANLSKTHTTNTVHKAGVEV